MKRTFLTLATIAILTFNSAFIKHYNDDLKISSLKDSRYGNLIQVDLSLNTKDTISISLIDIDGVTLYSERYIGTKYSKKFSLAVDDADLSLPIKVVVLSKRTGKINVYTFVPSEIINTNK